MKNVIMKSKRYKLLTPARCHSHWTDRHTDGSDLHERLVYSYLAYRGRLGLGASARHLCRETRLHPTTVATAISRLAATGLAERHAGEWRAVAPPEGVFVPR